MIYGQNFDHFVYIWLDYEFRCLVSRQFAAEDMYIFLLLLFPKYLDTNCIIRAYQVYFNTNSQSKLLTSNKTLFT